MCKVNSGAKFTYINFFVTNNLWGIEGVEILKRLKQCNICGQHLPLRKFPSKGKDKWMGYCKACKTIRIEMRKYSQIELPTLEEADEIEVRGQGGHASSSGYSFFVTYEKATQMIDEKVAYIVHPTLIREYFNGSKFRELVYARYSDRCFYCGGVANTIDHVVPVSKGGLSSFSNCIPACFTCNHNKDDMEMVDYLYYFKPSSIILGLTKVETIKSELLDMSEQVETINTYLINCLKKIEMKEDILENLERLMKLERTINRINSTIAKFRMENHDWLA